MKLKDLPTPLVMERDPGTLACQVFVPIKTVTGMNAREHWRVHHARVKKERAAMRRALLGRLVPTLPVVVTFTRLSTQTVDCDNVAPASKGLRDEIALLYGVGDSARDPIVWKYDQAKCKVGGHGVRVTIEHATLDTATLIVTDGKGNSQTFGTPVVWTDAATAAGAK